MSSVSDNLSSIRNILVAIRDEQALRSEAGHGRSEDGADSSQGSARSTYHPNEATHNQIISDQQDEIQAARRNTDALQLQLQQAQAGYTELKSAHEALRQRLSASQLECSAGKQRLNQVSASRAEERRVLRDVTIRSKESLEEHNRLSTDMAAMRAFDGQTTQLINWLMSLAYDATARSATLEKKLYALQSEQLLWAESRSLLSQVSSALHTSRDKEEELSQRVVSQEAALTDLKYAQGQALERIRTDLIAAQERANAAEVALRESAAVISNLTLATCLPTLTFESCKGPSSILSPFPPPAVDTDKAAEWKAQYEVEHASRLVAEEQLRSMQHSAIRTLSSYLSDLSSGVSNQAEIEATRERSDSLEKVNAQLLERVSALTVSHESMLADAKDLQHYLTHMEGSLLATVPTTHSVANAPIQAAAPCSGCQHAVDPSTAIKCSKCACMFHRSCARFPKNEARFVCDAHKAKAVRAGPR